MLIYQVITKHLRWLEYFGITNELQLLQYENLKCIKYASHILFACLNFFYHAKLKNHHAPFVIECLLYVNIYPQKFQILLLYQVLPKLFILYINAKERRIFLQNSSFYSNPCFHSLLEPIEAYDKI